MSGIGPQYSVIVVVASLEMREHVRIQAHGFNRGRVRSQRGSVGGNNRECMYDPPPPPPKHEFLFPVVASPLSALGFPDGAPTPTTGDTPDTPPVTADTPPSDNEPTPYPVTEPTGM